MKEKLEQWFDGIIEHSLALEALGDFRENGTTIGQMFSCGTVMTVDGERNFVDHAFQITDAKKAGEILELPVKEISRNDEEYPKEFYIEYKDWIVFSISK